MDNKKKYIIAIVLFIFLGLTIFTFANPSRNEEKNGDGKTDIEDKNNQDNIIDNGNNQNNGQDDNNNNNNNNNNNPANNLVQVIDNSYNLALEAVKNAEDKLDDESYENALDLVNKVTNENQKNELQERLDAVKDMIDAKKLVEELEKKVNTALDKDEMDNARDFRETEEIVSKVSNVINEELKKELEDKLEELAKLLDDVNSPVINIENGAILSSETSIEVEDENEFSMKLTKDGGAEEEIENGQTVGEGTYTLKVVDKAFNETVIEFIIDLTAPKFNIASGTHSTEDINVEIDDITLDYVEIYNQDKKTKELVQDKNFVLTEEGTYRLTAYDKAGHKTTVWVAIDKTSPVITGVENGKYYRTDVTATITDKFLVKVLVNDIEQTGIITTGTNNEGRELVLNFKEEGTYTIVAVDKVGNETTVTFTIDKTKPVITGVEDGKYYNTDVTPVISDVNFKNATLKRNGTHIKSYKPGDVITEEGTYTLVATDLAMNKTKLITFVIDKTAPKPVSTTYNPTTPTNGSVEVTIRVNEKLLPVEGWTLSEDGMAISRVFEENVNGNVTISDLAGNKVVRYYSIKNIDKEPPKPVSTTYNPTTPTNGSVEVTIRVNEKLLPVEGWTLSEDGMAISRVFEENVNGNVTISDLAGNKVVRYYSIKNIDKEPPKPVSTTYNPTTPTNGSVEVTIRVNEKLLPVEGWTLSEDGMAISRVFEENVNGNVTISDLAGNEVVRYYSIKNIDKNAPVVELFDDKGTSLADGAYTVKNVKAVITDENEYTAILTNQNNEEVEYVSGTMITKRGNYTLTVTDKAGNVTTVTFAIDKDYPLVYLNDTKYEKVNNNIVYFNRENGTVILSVKDLNLNTVTLTKNNNEITFTEGMTITEEGTYVITATDKANNITKVTFIIDKTAPIFKPEKWGYTLEADKNATFTCPTDMAQYVKDELSGLSKVVLDEWYAKNGSIPDQTKPGKFVCRYFSYDKAGNMVSNDIHYTVVDTTAPVITLNGEKNINLVSGVDTYTEEYATVTDNVDETITNLAPAYINYYTLDGTFLGRVSSVDTNNEGRYNLVYFTKDAAGNEATKVTRLVYVRLQEDSNKVSIQTAEDLLKISQNPEAYKGKLIVLTNDINLKGINWTPINAWNGVLNGTVIDGQGHSIKNMTVNDETLNAAGFISYNASSVTIKNLVFDNAFVKTKKANQTYAGVVMGKNYVKTTFENITVKNSRVENNWQSGGILGFAETNAQTFKNCTVENTFVGGENATSGSLFGLGDVDVNVINCVAKNVDLYTDGLTWNSTQKKENTFWVGHLYSKTLVVTSSTEENINIVK